MRLISFNIWCTLSLLHSLVLFLQPPAPESHLGGGGHGHVALGECPRLPLLHAGRVPLSGQGHQDGGQGNTVYYRHHVPLSGQEHQDGGQGNTVYYRHHVPLSSQGHQDGRQGNTVYYRHHVPLSGQEHQDGRQGNSCNIATMFLCLVRSIKTAGKVTHVISQPCSSVWSGASRRQAR